MNVLLLYPEEENSQKNIFSRLSAFLYRSKMENLKLIEISIHLPITWAEKLVDLNTHKLQQKDIHWADYIIVCADQLQTKATLDLVKLCRSSNAKLVLCGNAIQQSDEEFNLIDHLVANPAGFEVFSNDIANNTLQKIYTPVLTQSKSVPFHAYSLWGLIGNFSKQIHSHSA